MTNYYYVFKTCYNCNKEIAIETKSQIEVVSEIHDDRCPICGEELFVYFDELEVL